MATVLSKTFDIPHGAIVLQVQDALGNVSSHTGYVTTSATHHRRKRMDCSGVRERRRGGNGDS